MGIPKDLTQFVKQEDIKSMNSLQASHSVCSDVLDSLKAKPINNIMFKTLRVAQILKAIRIKMTTNSHIFKGIDPSGTIVLLF